MRGQATLEAPVEVRTDLTSGLRVITLGRRAVVVEVAAALDYE